jgi:RNA recognition motif-containing protein
MDEGTGATQGGNPKIFVGNLPYSTRQETIAEMFSAHGTVTDCYKPEQKGFAFVTMSSPEEAEKAMEALQGQMCEGRPMKLHPARPREERAPRY